MRQKERYATAGYPAQRCALPNDSLSPVAQSWFETPHPGTNSIKRHQADP